MNDISIITVPLNLSNNTTKEVESRIVRGPFDEVICIRPYYLHVKAWFSETMCKEYKVPSSGKNALLWKDHQNLGAVVGILNLFAWTYLAFPVNGSYYLPVDRKFKLKSACVSFPKFTNEITLWILLRNPRKTKQLNCMCGVWTTSELRRNPSHSGRRPWRSSGT